MNRFRERRPPRLKPIPRLLVVCEGSVTEPLYIDGVRRSRGIAKELVHIRGGGLSPKTVVESALEIAVGPGREDEYGPYDQVWCVFDKDDHPEVEVAFRVARSKGFHLAFSTPCIELFLYRHFADLRSDLHRTKLAAALRKFLPKYNKSFDFDKLFPNYPNALRRTKEVNRSAEVCNGVPSAPFCSFPELIEVIRKPI